jgi:NAD(P)-dependent dehydrogenase (short-subunit alcohol dehydrogenase family)
MAQMDGRVAIITGGASGIGAATTLLFVENNARVVIADLQDDLGNALAKEPAPNVFFQRTDVSREEDDRAAVVAAEKSFGRLNCIFNNAGVGGALGAITDTSTDEWNLTFEVLVRGVFLGMKHAHSAHSPAGRQHNLDSQRRRHAGWLFAACVCGSKSRRYPTHKIRRPRTGRSADPRQLYPPGLHRDSARAQHRRQTGKRTRITQIVDVECAANRTSW